MSKILVVNAGSSSVKYQLIDMEKEGGTRLAKGLVERIGLEKSFHTYTPNGGEKIQTEAVVPNHTKAIERALQMLLDPKVGVITDKSEITAVGHRVVHGGEKFASSTIITDEVMAQIKDCQRLAPLHNPHNIKGIEACQELFPDIPQVAVFDTAFHQTMPKHSFLYAIPYEFYTKEGIRRYGFHGTSHYYVARRAAEEMGKPLAELRIITVHLGNGASITAVDRGSSVDTSMGLTPLEGLVMGTRCGDLDPAIPLTLMRDNGISVEEMDRTLNYQSGILGLSGISNDMRDIETAAEEGVESALRAEDVFCYRLKKYIGAYSAVLGGLDALVFTGGIGENSVVVRAKSTEGLEFMGIKLDEALNQKLNRQRGKISAEDSQVAVFIIPTNEELVIAEDTYRCTREK
jgi:acetate kinase